MLVLLLPLLLLLLLIKVLLLRLVLLRCCCGAAAAAAAAAPAGAAATTHVYLVARCFFSVALLVFPRVRAASTQAPAALDRTQLQETRCARAAVAIPEPYRCR